LDKSSDELIKKLREQQNLTSSVQESAFRDSFGFKAYHNFIHNKERKNKCLVMELCRLMGHLRMSECQNCSGCLPTNHQPLTNISNISRLVATPATPTTPIEKLRKESLTQMDLLVKIKADSAPFFGRLEKFCLTCRKSNCDGLNVSEAGNTTSISFCPGVKYKCIKCGAEMSKHNANSCPVVLRLDSGRVCYGCHDQYDRVGESYHKGRDGGCPLKGRLRSYIQVYCRTLRRRRRLT
jgi:hypothetical protein